MVEMGIYEVSSVNASINLGEEVFDDLLGMGGHCMVCVNFVSSSPSCMQLVIIASGNETYGWYTRYKIFSIIS